MIWGDHVVVSQLACVASSSVGAVRTHDGIVSRDDAVVSELAPVPSASTDVVFMDDGRISGSEVVVSRLVSVPLWYADVVLIRGSGGTDIRVPIRRPRSCRFPER